MRPQIATLASFSGTIVKALTLVLFLMAGDLFAVLTITEVSPNQADPGTTSLLVTFTLPDTTPPTPPAGVLPTSVTIGSISGSSITHDTLDTVTAVFDIPADEAEGAIDVVMTFPNNSVTKTARVVEWRRVLGL
jgi:hypothetical protein